MPANERDAGRDRPGVWTAADVRQMLATEIDNVTANSDLDPIPKARVLAQLARVVLRAIELDMAARVEAIETALKLRTKEENR